MLTTRRGLLLGAASLLLAGCATDDDTQTLAIEPVATAYGPLLDEPYPVPAVDLKKLKPRYRRQRVEYQSVEPAGTIIVDTPNRYLYLITGNGEAMRYGVGIGRDGFRWAGRARIQYKRAWPKWTPPGEMIDRQPELEKFRNGQDPGLDNPLGARALYIFKDGQDTFYRLHGTADAASIGRAVSSGCVRLVNQDVIDLYDRVENGAPIIVLQQDGDGAA
ncbi:L,D-transpeptidase [soil metagenome]